ncbi:MAG: glutamine-hydrolyzing carbamoyl-phosphate synthase small subunit [Clostridia bacterium]|nr:glutamine-hydrolyzing carbamoyl-phosphate synthase small subunit [Clostridia bacterium]
MKLVLEDGSEFVGAGFGAGQSQVCELIFNTSMAGYQKIVYDPSYARQIVVMGYTLIGNYGMADDDFENVKPSLGGLVVRDYNDEPSNHTARQTLGQALAEHGIPMLNGVDTRAIMMKIRENGTCKAMLVDASVPTEQALARIRAESIPQNLVDEVGCKHPWFYRTADKQYKVAVIDCGVKSDLIRALSERGCDVTVVPYTTTADELRRLHPDGVLITHGPGSPEAVPQTVETVKALKGSVPMIGIGLGFGIIALSYGAKVTRMKAGHHGCNDPVRDLRSGEIFFTAQNHEYTVDADSLAGC